MDMQEKITLNDGTVIEPAHAIQAAGALWIYIDRESTMQEAFDMLSDRERTRRITAESYGEVNRHVGFTDLFCIRMETDGTVNAGLRKAGREASANGV